MSADVFAPLERSAIMRKVKGRDTRPELFLRRKLTRMGLRYRLHRKDLPGSPDIVFYGRKLAMFVHGCFWHGHDCKRGDRRPQTNAAYWAAKIDRNRVRDQAAVERLAALGWRVLVIWECELKREDLLDVRLGESLETTDTRPVNDRSSQSLQRPDGCRQAPPPQSSSTG